MITDYSILSDEEIVVLGRSGDKAALEHIMSEYKYLVRQKAKDYFLVGADRDDIVQEGMIGLFKAIRDFDDTKLTSFKTFAQMCIKRQIITAVKTATRQKHMPLNSYISLSKTVLDDDTTERSLIDTIAGAESLDPEYRVVEKESFVITQNKIDEVLSDFEIRVLQMYIDGKSYRDISVILERPAKSIDNALQRVKRKIAGIA